MHHHHIKTHGMTKKNTICVHRNLNQLEDAISAKKPLAGIVEVNQSNGKTAFEFRTVCHTSPEVMNVVCMSHLSHHLQK